MILLESKPDRAQALGGARLLPGKVPGQRQGSHNQDADSPLVLHNSPKSGVLAGP